MKVTLYSGQIQGGAQATDGASTLERDVMLVYDGTFQSMDGEVTITPDHLHALAKAHNARIDRLALAAGDPANINMADYPPVQLDHTSSARDTVGRVISQLRVAETTIDGAQRLGLFGRVRFIGKENVAPASDGRWTNVSIGADLEPGKEHLKELSVTPFPAAARAALLSKGATSMNKEKLKKYLMESTKCSDKEADEKLSKMSDDDQKKLAADADEHEKKMAADEEEKKKLAAEEEEKKKLAEGDDKDKDEKKELAAKREKLARLAGEAKAVLNVTTAEVKKGSVSARLAKLRATQKITPAEEKVLLGALKTTKGEVRLSESSDDALELVFAVLEAREPVVVAGQLGSIKAVDLSGAGNAMKGTRLAQMEKEMLANMPTTRTLLAGTNGDDPLKGDTVNLAASDQVPDQNVRLAQRPADAVDPHTADAKDETIAKLLEQNAKMAGLLEQMTAAI